MSTRVLSTNREKILTTALILMAVPCLPQSAMIVALGVKYSLKTVIFIFGTLAVFSVLVNSLLNKLMKGETADLFMEIPSYRMPSARMMASKLKLRIVDYFAEVLPLIIVGVLIMNILDSIGFINFLTETLKVPIRQAFGLPPEIASIMLLGFLRKDVSIALLAPLHLNAHQFITASIFLVLYIPCISSFFTLIKELKKSALKVIAIIFISAVVLTCLLHLVLNAII
jgi:ferrous iron transport protein B